MRLNYCADAALASKAFSGHGGRSLTNAQRNMNGRTVSTIAVSKPSVARLARRNPHHDEEVAEKIPKSLNAVVL